MLHYAKSLYGKRFAVLALAILPGLWLQDGNNAFFANVLPGQALSEPARKCSSSVASQIHQCGSSQQIPRKAAHRWAGSAGHSSPTGPVARGILMRMVLRLSKTDELPGAEVATGSLSGTKPNGFIR